MNSLLKASAMRSSAAWSSLIVWDSAGNSSYISTTYHTDVSFCWFLETG
jgi:hypothetical protein